MTDATSPQGWPTAGGRGRGPETERSDLSAGPLPAGRRTAVLDILRTSAHALTIADLAGRLRLHPNTVRFHLKTLMRGGQVEQVAGVRGAPGRPAQAFRAVGDVVARPRQYRLLAEMLVDGLLSEPEPGTRAVAVGRRWGRRYGPASAGQGEHSATPWGGGPGPALPAPMDHLVGLLDQLGFDPERGPGPAPDQDSTVDLRLRNCPFLELASTHPEVTCGIHLGVMQGALSGSYPPVDVAGLDRFPEPGVCIARVVRR